MTKDILTKLNSRTQGYERQLVIRLNRTQVEPPLTIYHGSQPAANPNSDASSASDPQQHPFRCWFGKIPAAHQRVLYSRGG
jgi:hypothetical protein